MGGNLRKIGIGLVVVIALAVTLLGVVAIALPRLVARDDFQTNLRDTATKALGAPVEWAGLEAGILPPRLTITQPSVAVDVDQPEEAGLRADTIDLRVALIPIFRSQIEVESLILRGAEIVVRRTAEGFAFPLADLLSGSASDETDEETAEQEEGAGFELAVRQIRVSDSRVILRDQTHSPESIWRLDEIEIDAQPEITSASVVLDLNALVQSGDDTIGQLTANGSARLGGAYDFVVRLNDFLLGAFSPYLGSSKVGGVLTGEIIVAGDEAADPRFEVDLVVEDLAPASDVDLVGRMSLRAKGTTSTPIDLRADLDLGEGGRVDLEGTSTSAGALDLRARFEALDLALSNAALADSELEVAGLATGTGRLVGPAASPDSLVVEADVASGRIRATEYSIDGPFRIGLNVDSPFSPTRRGTVDLDLTKSKIDYQGQFTKRVGLRAEMKTDFGPGPDGALEFESRINFKDVDEILMQGSFRDETRVVFSTPPFNVEGWSEILPALADVGLDGVIAFDRLELRSQEGAKSRFQGRVLLDAVGLKLPDRKRIGLQGSIVGGGSALRTEDFRLTVGGLTLGIEGSVEDPLDTRQFALVAQSIGRAETNDVVSALTSSPDTLFGDLKLDADLAGVAGASDDFYSAMLGSVKLAIGASGGGRLQGISLLEATLEKFPALLAAAKLTRSLQSGKGLDRYLGDEFEVILGEFQIANGKVLAETLRLVYEGYEANLTGAVELDGLKIDMTGDVVLSPEVARALGGLLKASEWDGNSIRIPLARVTNTLSAPKVVMTEETLAAIPKLLINQSGIDNLSRGVGRALGRVLGGD